MPIAVPGVYAGNVPNDVTVFNDRLVAVGGVNDGCCDASFSKRTRALVWISRDAAEWRLAPESDVFDLGHMVAVAANGTNIVAVGTLNLKSEEYPGAIDFRPAVWTSQDAQHWTVVRDVPALVDIVSGPTGFLAAAQTDAGPEIWASATGSDWDRVAGASELGTGEALRLVATDLGYLLLGVDLDAEKGLLWRSTDGASWDRVPSHEAFIGAHFEDGAAIGGRLIVVGWNDNAPDKAWTSVDGLSWEAAGDDFGVENGTIRNAIVTNGTLLVTGLDWGAVDVGPPPMASWTSVDGVTWARVPDMPDELRPIHEINDWVAWGDGVIAVGTGDPQNPGEIVGPGAVIIR